MDVKWLLEGKELEKGKESAETKEGKRRKRLSELVCFPSRPVPSLLRAILPEEQWKDELTAEK